MGIGLAMVLAGVAAMVAVLIVNAATTVPRSVRLAPTRARHRHRA